MRSRNRVVSATSVLNIPRCCSQKSIATTAVAAPAIANMPARADEFDRRIAELIITIEIENSLVELAQTFSSRCQRANAQAQSRRQRQKCAEYSPMLQPEEHRGIFS